MFCPQCGTESVSDELKFCRLCGANLRVIGKAVTLSEAIARSDSVPNKIKDLVKSFKIEKITEEVSRALDKMNQELVQSAGEKSRAISAQVKSSTKKKGKTSEERRERHLTKGAIRMFWGAGVSTFLYFLSPALVLKLPPEAIVNIPFEVGPVVPLLWLIGLIPISSGLGHILAGLMIKTRRPAAAEEISPLETPEGSPLRIDQPTMTSAEYGEETVFGTPGQPASVTDRTTNILKHKVANRTNELESEH